MNFKIKRFVAIVLVLTLLTTSFSLSVFADYIGAGGGAGNTLHEGNWNENKSGYRITAVDPNTGKRVSNSVDFLFSSRPTNGFHYSNYKTEALGSCSTEPTYIMVSDMLKTAIKRDKDGNVYDGFDSSNPMPHPVYYKQGTKEANGNGQSLKKWMLDGAKQINAKYPSSSGNSGNSGSASGDNSDSDSFSSISSLTNAAVRKSQLRLAISGLSDSEFSRAKDAATSSYRGIMQAIALGKKYTKSNVAYEAIQSAKGMGYSSKMQVYIVSFIINSYCGASWSGTATSITSVSTLNFSKATVQSLESAVSDKLNATQLNNEKSGLFEIADEEIPLSDSEGKNAYIRSILNYKKNGTAVFQFLNTVPDSVKSADSVVDKVAKGGYKVIIESIFWYQPQNSSGGYFKFNGTNPIVYGTATNLAQWSVWAKSHLGWNDGGKGGWYYNITNRTGAWGLYLDGNPGIAGLSAPDSSKEGQVIANVELARTDIGYAIHCYAAEDDPIPPSITNSDTGLILHESEISKAVETANSNIQGWGAKAFNFKYSDLSGKCSAKVKDGKNLDGTDKFKSCKKEYRIADGEWSYNFKNTLPVNSSLVANVTGFLPINKVGSDASGTRTDLGAGSDTVNSFDYQFSIWRGKDIPTIAKYIQPASVLNGLLSRFGNTPSGNRGVGYSENLTVSLQEDSSKGDYITTSKCPAHSNGKSSTASSTDITNYNGQVKVESYWGKARSVGNATLTGLQPFRPYISSIGSSCLAGSGYPIQNSSIFRLYPFIRMTYQTPGATTKTSVNVLSQWLRQIQPNDYAEAGYYNNNNGLGLNMNSYQWCLHAKATSGSKGWNKPNQVLPGGAIYTLDTKNSNNAVAIVTYQNYLNPEQRAALASAAPNSEFTLSGAENSHNAFKNMAKNTLDNLKVVQWVNRDANSATITSGNALKVTGGGQSLSTLGISGVTGSEAKYYLRGNTSANKANEGDLDIISENTVKTYYKVFSDISGIVCVQKSNDNAAWQTIDKLGQEQDASALTDFESQELDRRTKLVTNYITAMERNTGSDDTAEWGKHWYNEASLGFCVVRTETKFIVGLKYPGIRSACLDVKLEPTRNSQRDLFESAHKSLFCMDSKSDYYPDKPNHYIGSFKNHDILMNSMESMFKSKVFYIVNASVSDLLSTPN